ncbi:MAG: hypothetical protein VYC63_06340 [Verrucomicrobiota bacterium]|nr:hypothetical protein [Verrucomicrobiota bacterium]
MNSWLLKRLRPTSSPLVRGRETIASDSASNAERAEVNNQLTVDQEIKVLAHAANELQKAYSDVISGLNNIHGRKLQELNEPFTQRLNALIKALQDDDMDRAKDSAKRLMLLINEMQANIPAWDFVRALQLLADRCKTLG